MTLLYNKNEHNIAILLYVSIFFFKERLTYSTGQKTFPNKHCSFFAHKFRYSVVNDTRLCHLPFFSLPQDTPPGKRSKQIIGFNFFLFRYSFTYRVSQRGCDGIPVELFQILKDDAVKVPHSICLQIWKAQQWPEDWKMSIFIPIPKKGNPKECSNYCTIALISHASKEMLKILQARLQQYVYQELPDVQAGFRKGRGARD